MMYGSLYRKTQDARKLSPEAQAALRVHVVRAVNRGLKIAHAAAAFDVSRTVIYCWLGKHRGGGVRALRSHKRGPKGRAMMET
jgi:transposase